MDTDVAFTLITSQLELLSDALMECGKSPEALLRLVADEVDERLFPYVAPAAPAPDLVENYKSE